MAPVVTQNILHAKTAGHGLRQIVPQVKAVQGGSAVPATFRHAVQTGIDGQGLTQFRYRGTGCQGVTLPLQPRIFRGQHGDIMALPPGAVRPIGGLSALRIALQRLHGQVGALHHPIPGNIHEPVTEPFAELLVFHFVLLRRLGKKRSGRQPSRRQERQPPHDSITFHLFSFHCFKV